MNFLKKKSPTFAESSLSENIHLSSVNSIYFNMILSNDECAKFCCDVLRTFDDLLNKYHSDNPHAYKGHELDVFISLYNQIKVTTNEC